MGLWKIVIPETTTNYIKNPSFEESVTDDWTLWTGTALSRTSDYQKFGDYCAEVNSHASLDTLISNSTNISLAVGATIAASAWVIGGGVSGYLGIFDQTNTTLRASVSLPAGSDWERISCTWTNNTAGTVSVRIRVANTESSAGIKWYVDAVQAEYKTYITDYCDGDQDGCGWLYGEHNAVSFRDVITRSGGGRELDFVDDLGLFVRMSSGVGMGLSSHHVNYQPMIPGALYRGKDVKPRVLTLTLLAKGSDLEDLHSKRQALIDAIKPDVVRGDQPFLLRYTGGSTTVEISVIYDSGLEAQGTDSLLDKIVLRCIAYDPYWYEQGEVSVALDGDKDVTTADYNVSRIRGNWQSMGSTGLNNTVRCMAFDPISGLVYVGGDFTTAGGSSANYVASWDGSSWSNLGSGLNGICRDMAVKNGVLYVVGDFTQAGGATANRLAKWDGSSWSTYGTGANGVVYCIHFDRDHDMYVGGAFTSVNGTAANRIAKTSNQLNFSALGSGLNGNCLTISSDSKLNIYAGGSFTTAGGSTANRCAFWDGSSWDNLGTGMNSDVKTIAVGKDDHAYMGGSYTTVNGVSFDGMVKWDGNQFVYLNPEITGTIHRLIWGEDGLLYCGGDFSWAGNVIPLYACGIWNGSTWIPIDCDPDQNLGEEVYVVLPVKRSIDTDIYIGMDQNTTSRASKNVTINNPGSARTYPQIISKNGAMQVCNWRNLSTGKSVLWTYSQLSTIYGGERVELDFRPGRRTMWSNRNGEIWSALLQGSDFADMYLLPGDNYCTYFQNSTTEVFMRYRVAHESYDGGAA